MPNSTKISKPTVGALFNVLDTKAKAERKKSQEIESKREARLRKERRQQYARDPEELKASLASSLNLFPSESWGFFINKLRSHVVILFELSLAPVTLTCFLQK